MIRKYLNRGAAVRISWTVLRIHRQCLRAIRSGGGLGTDHRRASGQSQQHVRNDGREKGREHDGLYRRRLLCWWRTQPSGNRPLTHEPKVYDFFQRAFQTRHTSLGGNMSRSAILLGIVASLVVTAGASAAMHRDASDLATQMDSTMAPPVAPESSGYGGLLRHYGVEPGSEKARTVLKWVGRIRNDPVIARNLPDGADSVEEVFLDPAKRQVLMSDGVARLDAADRLRYVQLITNLYPSTVTGCRI